MNTFLLRKQVGLNILWVLIR